MRQAAQLVAEAGLSPRASNATATNRSRDHDVTHASASKEAIPAPPNRERPGAESPTAHSRTETPPPRNGSPPPPTTPVLPPPRTTSPPPQLARGLAHLTAVAPSLAPLIARHPCPLFDTTAPPPDAFESLASGIVSQQVSGAAARSIKARVAGLFAGAFPTAAQTLATPVEVLHAAGLTRRKAEYLHALAHAFASGAVSGAALAAQPDDAVVAQLTQIRGIGVWSAEMFLIFGLRRPDVFSVGDLGIQRGIAAFLGRDVAAVRRKRKADGKTAGGKWKYLSEDEMRRTAEPFRPWRSLFCWYMWRIEGTGGFLSWSGCKNAR